jgi:hypothetical protein
MAGRRRRANMKSPPLCATYATKRANAASSTTCRRVRIPSSRGKLARRSRTASGAMNQFFSRNSST